MVWILGAGTHSNHGPLQEINCTTAHNIHSPRVSLGQPGGTGILITLPTLFEYAPNHGCRSQGSRPMDVMELSHTPDHVTRLVSAYCPCSNSSDKGLKTVYRQHLNYIQQENLGHTPYQLFFDDLILQLKQWRAKNERIFCIDLNKHSLTGKISPRLWSDNIKLHESTHNFWPEGHKPNTHINGSRPIDGIFTIPDIDVTNSLLLSFHESVGDHRTMILEFTTASSIGRFQGRIVCPSSCRLTLKQPGTVKSYNTSIHEKFATHKIPERLLGLLLKSQEQYTFPLPQSFGAKCNTIHEQISVSKQSQHAKKS